MSIEVPPVPQLFVTDKMSDAEVQETLEEVTLALGVLGLQAETVILAGVVAALTGVAVMSIEKPRIEMIEAERVFSLSFTGTSDSDNYLDVADEVIAQYV